MVDVLKLYQAVVIGGNYMDVWCNYKLDLLSIDLVPLFHGGNAGEEHASHESCIVVHWPPWEVEQGKIHH